MEAAIYSPLGLPGIEAFIPMGPLDPPFRLVGAGYDPRKQVFADIEAVQTSRGYSVDITFSGVYAARVVVDARSGLDSSCRGSKLYGGTEVSVSLDLCFRRIAIVVQLMGFEGELTEHCFDIFLQGR